MTHPSVHARTDFEAELPRTPTGKLVKRHLRDKYWPKTGVRVKGFLPFSPLWEKVAIGGLWPPFFNRTPMLCIGYAKSASDEGSLSAETDPSPVSNSLRSFEPPSPTRGEGRKSGDRKWHD